MRVTQNGLFNNVRYQMQTSATRLMRTQQEASTQKRIINLSDDVVDSGRVLDLKAAQRRSDQYLENIRNVDALAGVYDQSLGEVGDLIARAKELLLKESNEVTSTAATREATRVEIAMLTNQLVAVGNTRHNGQYIYAGFATDQAAFADASATVVPAAIAGRAAVTRQAVSDSAQLTYHNYQINFTGPGVFNVVDSSTGIAVLSARTYTSGQTISFAGLEVALTDTPGAPLAGDSYTVSSTPPGMYMGDGGVQEVEIQTSTKVAQNLPGGRVLQGSGVAGGVDLFATLNNINIALRNNDRPAMEAMVTQLDTARSQISNERSANGARVNLLDGVKQRQEEVSVTLSSLVSGLEDVDLAEALTELQRQQTAYEATLSTASRVMQYSLMDFLR